MALHRPFRRLAVATAAACALGTTAAAPVIDQTGNLLLNGNFESGSTTPVSSGSSVSAASALTNWLQYSNSTGTTSTWANAPLIEGDHLAQVAGGINDGLYQYFGLGSGDYTVSAWVKVLSGSAKLGIGWNGGSTAAFASALPTQNDWQYVSFTASVSNSSGGALLYGGSENSQFLVDGVWMNAGSISASPFDPERRFNPNSPVGNVPEPGTLALIGAALAAAATLRRRRR